MIEKTMKEFARPGKEYRGAPFWAWNSKIEPDEARRQIRILKEMGMGGFFMHARVGMNVPYLQQEWFDCVKACVDEARCQDMDAWLYDEDRWPSGSAGGIITRGGNEFRVRGIRVEAADAANPDPGATLGYFAVKPVELISDEISKEGGVDFQSGKTPNGKCKVISGYRRLKDAAEKTGEDEIVCRFYEYIESDNSWYNGGAYLDTLNKKAVEKFIETTHEAYAREVGDEFGKIIPGIFFDEPNYIPIPWTPAFPETFRNMCGYEILDVLPELFFRVNDVMFMTSRYDYLRVATKLFAEAFAGSIGKWCAGHGIAATGHMLEEDTLYSQVRCVGDAMQSYEYMQVPGIDLLTEKWNIFDTAKQCVSVARQFGRPRRISETYGCTGWDFPMEGHKALGDWQLALGINIRCQHLAWYSMEGENKRDYPASIFRQSPWWRKYSEVEDYFARLNSVMTAGKEQIDLLVVHPIESMWGLRYADERSAEMAALDNAFTALRNELLEANLDFDYGDEEIMSRHASVDGKLFRVAKAEYKAVSMQKLLTVRSSTLKLLSDFAAAGGLVTYTGNPPEYVDGRKSDAAVKAYAAFRQVETGRTAEAVAPVVRRVSIAENGKEIKPVLSLLTDLGDALALFVCNTSSSFTDSDNQRNQEKTRSRKLEFPGAEITVFSPERGFVRELDPRTGLVHSVNFTYSNGAYRFSTPMERFASRLYIITDKKLSEVRPAVSHEKASGMSVGLPAVGLEFEVDEDNVIVLDHASYKIANRESDGEEFVLEIDDKIRDAIGCQHRGGHMCQPWTRRNEPDGIAVPVSLAFKFKCAVLPASDCFLALEMADSFAVEINGRRIEKKNCGFWMDPCLVKIPVPRDCIVRGENKIVISGKYNRKMTGMEAMFLIGRFGVDAAGCMVAYPKSISIGDWVPQGLPNYTGNLTYRIPLPEIPAGSRAVVRVPRWRGAALEIGVNDGEKTLVPWSPYELDISGKTGAGANTLEITVYGNRRNACGPFYFKNTAEEGWYGPGQMRRHDFAERELVMMGILKQVELIIR